MLKYGARSKRRQPSGYWFTMLTPLHSNSHNYRPLLRLSLTNLHSFLCHIFCLSSSFTLRAANCVRWSLADDRPRSRRSRFSSFVERWPPVTDETDTIGDLVASKISGYTRDLENTAGARFYFHPVVSNDVQGWERTTGWLRWPGWRYNANII